MKKRLFINNNNIDEWITTLTIEFRVFHIVIMKIFSIEKYSMKNVVNNRISKNYAQTMIRFEKFVEFSTFNQLFQIWNELNIDFQKQIEKFIKKIKISDFLHQLNNKKKIWHKMKTKTKNSKFARNQIANDKKNNRSFQKNMLNANNQRNQNFFIDEYNNFRSDFQFDFQSTFFFMQTSNFNFYYQQYSDFQNQNRVYSQQQYYQQQSSYQRNQFSNDQSLQQTLSSTFLQKQIVAKSAIDSKKK